jgi:hypothetical protein
MRPRALVTGLLLAFVAASVVALVVKQTRRAPANGPVSSPAAVTAYYFHGNVRCATCRKLEAYSRAAIATGFDTRAVQWLAVNVDEPAHEHFVKDYSLTTRALVLVETGTGRWQNLTNIWDLVGDDAAFTKYVQDETRAFVRAR